MQLFNHHLIRSNLLQVWLKYGKERIEARPMWIAPEEVIYKISENKEESITICQDLTKVEANQILLNTEKELEYKYNWWLYLQIKDLLNSDKKYGFREQKTKLEMILSGEESKIISKIYKILLERYTTDEAVKEQMVKWAININAEITTKWDYLWKRTSKISTCTALQENNFKKTYCWYMTPKKLAR